MSGDRPLVKFVIFTILCLIASAALVVTIGNFDPFEDRANYEAVFGDVTGLVENDAVKVAGVEVGKVVDIRVERGQAVVRFSIRDDVRLGEDTTVGVRWRSLLGLRYLYVYPGGDGRLEAGHRFPPERTLVPADFGLLMERLTPVMRSLDPEVGNVVVQALSEALVGREDEVQQLIAEAGSLTNHLADRDVEIGRLLDNAAVLVQAYVEREQELRQLLDNFADVSTTIAGRNDELERVIIELAQAEAELSHFLEVNDGNIRGSIDELETITSILSVNHENLEDIITYLGRGLVGYHRISRWGQWFNVRVVGTSHAGGGQQAERGGTLPPEEPEGGGSTSMGGFLRGVTPDSGGQP